MGGSLWFDGPGGWLFTDFRVVNLMATGFPQSGSINQQSWAYPLVNIQKAIEHGTFIVDFPIKNANFPIVMLVYQRVGRELLTAKRTVIPFGGLIGTEYLAKLDNIHKFMDLIQQNRPIPVVFPNNFEFDLHPSPFNWMFNYILIAFCRRKTTTN